MERSGPNSGAQNDSKDKKGGGKPDEPAPPEGAVVEPLPSLVPPRPRYYTRKTIPVFQRFIDQTFSILFSDTPDRGQGRNGITSEFSLRFDNGQIKTYYIASLYYQMAIGAIGGTTCGIETDHFAPPRLGFLAAQERRWPTFVDSLRSGCILFRFASRLFVSAILFDTIDKNLEEGRGKRDWVNFAGAGALSGGFFGLQGGVRGCGTSILVCGIFGGLAGYFEGIFRQNH